MMALFIRLKYISLLTFLLLPALNAHAQTSSVINASMEIKNEREMYSKLFLKTNGDKEAIFSSSPVHYNKNGTWEEINTMIHSNQNGFQNETNIIQSYFPNSIGGFNKIKLIINANDEIFIHSEKKLVLFNNQTELTTIPIKSDPSIANIVDNTIRYGNIYPGISDEFTILNGQIKNNVILNTPPTFLNNVSSEYFGFQETLELPIGWKIVASDNSLHSFTSSALIIIDSENNPLLTVPAPVFFDSYGLASDGANMVEGKYLIGQENNRWSIATLIPVKWLNDENTKYPISIDPTIVIAGTTGGWQSPNNWVDNPAFVFIGVCCGNLTHRAWIKFNTTAIPDGTCISNVELQVNVTTVANATAELTHITDVTGAFGPYGGIDPPAYNDFGTGLYNSFTITGVGIYGYYGLGATANTLLQAQLPGNWFQIALMFNNEPSTNYKIISATTSNLRVTYPCALPVELLSFDAKCNSDRVNLTWTTASEINNHQFTIARSTDGINYEIIGTVEGSGTSNQAHNYSFVDAESVEGPFYYSLQQTDFDGTSEYLGLVAISCANTSEFKIFPNPSSGTFIIEGAEQDDDVIITDVLGQIVFQTKIIGEKIEIDLSEHHIGTYFIQRVSRNGAESKKIIINK